MQPVLQSGICCIVEEASGGQFSSMDMPWKAAMHGALSCYAFCMNISHRSTC